MKRMKFSYDTECEKLSRYFLASDDKTAAEIDIDAPKLAQLIQDVVEVFVSINGRSSD